MTATEPRTLDALLASAEPQDAEPFDLGALIPHEHWCLSVAHGDCCGNGEEECDCDAWKTRISVALLLNKARVDTENARRWVDRLQGECAAKDSAMREALKWLDMAASYSPTEDCDAAISDAQAALRAGLRDALDEAKDEA